MARAALAWSIKELATAAGIGERTAAKFEIGGNVVPETVAKMRQALEREGVVFIERGVYVGGVVPPAEGR
jgi:transcriptional regulator with XRE-family HTH domain